MTARSARLNDDVQKVIAHSETGLRALLAVVSIRRDIPNSRRVQASRGRLGTFGEYVSVVAPRAAASDRGRVGGRVGTTHPPGTVEEGQASATERREREARQGEVARPPISTASYRENSPCPPRYRPLARTAAPTSRRRSRLRHRGQGSAMAASSRPPSP